MRRLSTRLLPETIRVQKMGEDYGDGPTTIGEPVLHRARIVRENVLVRTKLGAETVSSARVYVRPGTIGLGDRVFLGGDAGPSILLGIREQYDRHHLVALVLDIA